MCERPPLRNAALRTPDTATSCSLAGPVASPPFPSSGERATEGFLKGRKSPLTHSVAQAERGRLLVHPRDAPQVSAASITNAAPLRARLASRAGDVVETKGRLRGAALTPAGWASCTLGAGHCRPSAPPTPTPAAEQPSQDTETCLNQHLDCNWEDRNLGPRSRPGSHLLGLSRLAVTSSHSSRWGATRSLVSGEQRSGTSGCHPGRARAPACPGRQQRLERPLRPDGGPLPHWVQGQRLQGSWIRSALRPASRGRVWLLTCRCVQRPACGRITAQGAGRVAAGVRDHHPHVCRRLWSPCGGRPAAPWKPGPPRVVWAVSELRGRLPPSRGRRRRPRAGRSVRCASSTGWSEHACCCSGQRWAFLGSRGF